MNLIFIFLFLNFQFLNFLAKILIFQFCLIFEICCQALDLLKKKEQYHIFIGYFLIKASLIQEIFSLIQFNLI